MVWPLLIGAGAWLLCEGIRGSRSESHQQRMREIEGGNGGSCPPALGCLPPDYPEMLESEYDQTARRRG